MDENQLRKAWGVICVVFLIEGVRFSACMIAWSVALLQVVGLFIPCALRNRSLGQINKMRRKKSLHAGRCARNCLVQKAGATRVFNYSESAHNILQPSSLIFTSQSGRDSKSTPLSLCAVLLVTGCAVLTAGCLVAAAYANATRWFGHRQFGM